MVSTRPWGCHITYDLLTILHRAERKEGVAKSIENRQKKREENLAARRDSKKSNKKGAKKPAPKKKNRPGFEGGFVGKKSKK